jgi:hypothetical protein
MAPRFLGYVLVCIVGCCSTCNAQGSQKLVSCVNRTANLGDQIRNTCCLPWENCRRYSFGGPTKCDSKCAALVVPIFADCGYLYAPFNNTVPDSWGKSKYKGSGFSLTALFDMCTKANPASYPGTPDAAVPNCPATQLSPAVGSKSVHDYDTHWEMCSLNVPRLSEMCRADTVGCFQALGPNMCGDPYAPYYSECLIFMGQCKDDPLWKDEFDDDCKFYAEHDPGCTSITDRGQRKNCPVTCNTCTDPCHDSAKKDQCSVERLRHWYRGDAWSCASLETTEGYKCDKAKACGLCDNKNMPAKSFNVTGPTMSSALCELAESAIEKVCCFDAGVPCDGNPPATCTPACARVMAVVDQCSHRQISTGTGLLSEFWKQCSQQESKIISKGNKVSPAMKCFSALEGYGNECDGEECCLSQSTAGFHQLWNRCQPYVRDTNTFPFFWLDKKYTAAPQTYITNHGCASYILACPASQVTALYTNKGFLLAGDCCSTDKDCSADLFCDKFMRVCTKRCKVSSSRKEPGGVNNDCGHKPATTARSELICSFDKLTTRNNTAAVVAFRRSSMGALAGG